MFTSSNHLIRDETAASAVEYALLLGAIALAAFFALHGLGRTLDRVFDNARDAIRNH